MNNKKKNIQTRMQLIYSFTTSLHLNIQGNDSIYKFCSKQESSINQGMEMKLSKRSLGNKHTDHKLYIQIHNLRNKTNLRTSKEGDSGRSFRDGLHLSIDRSIDRSSWRIVSWIEQFLYRLNLPENSLLDQNDLRRELTEKERRRRRKPYRV